MDAKLADFSLTFGPRIWQYMFQKVLKNVSNRELQMLQFGSLAILIILVRQQRWVRSMLVSGAKASVLFGTLATVFITSTVLLARKDRDGDEDDTNKLDKLRDWW